MVIESLKSLSRSEKFQFFSLIVSRILANFLDLAALGLIGLTASIASGNPPYFEILERLALEQNEQVLLLSSAAGILFVLKTGLGLLLNKLTFSFLAKTESRLASNIVDWVFGAGISRTRSLSQSEIQWTILRSSHTALTGILSNFSSLVTEASLALMLVVLFLFTDFWISLAVVLYISIVGAGFYLATRRSFDTAGTNYARSSVTVDEQILELVRLFKELFALGKTPLFLKELKESRGQVSKVMASELWLQSLPRIIIEIALLVGEIGRAHV